MINRFYLESNAKHVRRDSKQITRNDIVTSGTGNGITRVRRKCARVSRFSGYAAFFSIIRSEWSVAIASSKKSNSDGREQSPPNVKANCQPFPLFMSSLTGWPTGRSRGGKTSTTSFFHARPCPGINYCRSLNTFLLSSSRDLLLWTYTSTEALTTTAATRWPNF